METTNVYIWYIAIHVIPKPSPNLKPPVMYHIDTFVASTCTHAVHSDGVLGLGIALGIQYLPYMQSSCQRCNSSIELSICRYLCDIVKERRSIGEMTSTYTRDLGRSNEVTEKSSVHPLNNFNRTRKMNIKAIIAT